MMMEINQKTYYIIRLYFVRTKAIFKLFRYMFLNLANVRIELCDQLVCASGIRKVKLSRFPDTGVDCICMLDVGE